METEPAPVAPVSAAEPYLVTIEEMRKSDVAGFFTVFFASIRHKPDTVGETRKYMVSPPFADAATRAFAARTIAGNIVFVCRTHQEVAGSGGGVTIRFPHDTPAGIVEFLYDRLDFTLELIPPPEPVPANPTPTPTPETDAFRRKIGNWKHVATTDVLEFAENLERERDEARALSSASVKLSIEFGEWKQLALRYHDAIHIHGHETLKLMVMNIDSDYNRMFFHQP